MRYVTERAPLMLFMRVGRAGEEAIIPLAVPKHLVPPAARFRSTWLTSSLRSLRERGRLDDYLARLPREHHASVLESVAGVWLPTEVALCHYEACDGLGLAEKDVMEIGAEVTKRAHGTVIDTVVKLGTGMGVTPWTILAQLQKLWDRIWVGGAVAVYKLGPKEARVEIVSWPCARIRYCQIAMRGVLQGVVEFFCRRAYVHEVKSMMSSTSLAYRIQWA